MVSMSATIQISTGARLHFGFFAHRGGEPSSGSPNYGGVGLMIDSPGFVLLASENDLGQSNRRVWLREWEPCEFQVGSNLPRRRAVDSDPFADPPAEAWQDLAHRAVEVILRYRAHSREKPPPCCQIDLRSAMLPHRGLGAGTQLGMAVGKALSLLSGEVDIQATTLSQRVGRGARSAIGIHGFERGGFLMDAGKRHADEIGRLEARVDVPENWRFVLIHPPDAHTGLSGHAESAALSRLPPMSDAMTERLRGLALAQMLPALAAGDCDRFGDAAFEFGRLVGEYFRPIQGGTYSTPRAAELVDWIRQQGFRGIAQTSWGPTLAVCCADQASAQSLCDKLQADPRWRGCATHIAAALNSGARIETISSTGAA
jgi:beta-ribofuranosylaminobenzene 5'-phosphate synthase